MWRGVLLRMGADFALEFDICLPLLDVNEVCLSGVFFKGAYVFYIAAIGVFEFTNLYLSEILV